MTPQEIKQRAIKAWQETFHIMSEGDCTDEQCYEAAFNAYEQAQWVKVEDGLPEKGALFKDNEGDIFSGEVLRIEEEVEGWLEEYTCIATDGRTVELGEITHWRPLPTFGGEE